MLNRVALRICMYSVFVFSCSAIRAQTPGPKIDKPKLETYLRYAEGFTAQVKISIDDPTPSPFKGFFRLLVHITAGPHTEDRLYYITADSERLINGSIWQLNEDPFLDTLNHLPTDGPAFGPANARVTIVVFSDFECPYCRELAKTLRQNVPQKYPNDVRVIFEDFPIESIHKWARAASEGARCLADQKTQAFWAFHDWIFEHQQEVNEGNVREKVLAIGKDQGGRYSKAFELYGYTCHRAGDYTRRKNRYNATDHADADILRKRPDGGRSGVVGDGG